MSISHKKYTFCIIAFFGILIGFSQKQTLPKWEKGFLDIHHINTGRGDAAFLIFPDGTTLLVDAGDMSEMHPRTLSPRNAKLMPNRSRSAPEWIVDYIQQFLPEDNSQALDYALITHYHDDHFGEMDVHRKMDETGKYALTGITEVGNLLPIRTLLDRGSQFPINLKDPKVQAKLGANDSYSMITTLRNYWKFIARQTELNGMVHETLVTGELDQIHLRKSMESYPDFHIRNIAVNGEVWTGEDSGSFPLFSEGNYPGENSLSTCIKISYGKFDYFTGGDVSGMDGFGGADINSVESHIAPVIGPVDVATLNHHGNRDSQNPFYVRTVRPRIWIQQNWSSDHPGEEVLRRISSTSLYPGERDIFSTVMLQPNKDVIGGRLDTYKSQNGHIVVRVYDNGSSYKVYILNDATEEREVLSKHGPYASR
ncbi:ComEC/Rec2 family competence protein [Ulvibacterium sp.]|uniref:ComEC/Rec2 family competence protein n=1 Tax=Ulvibacterium sp. TaxID=2665914 RepID=UPI003CC6DA1B